MPKAKALYLMQVVGLEMDSILLSKPSGKN